MRTLLFQPLRLGPARSPGELPAFARRGRQRGVSLFITLVMLLLALIVVLGALAVGNLNESLVGNQSDAQRAYGAAQALLDAAQRDIRLNGRYCTSALGGNSGTNDTIDGTPLGCTGRYPADGDASKGDYMQILGTIGGANKCAGAGAFLGVCIADSPTNSDFDAHKVGATGSPQATDNGATYAAYASGVSVGSASTQLNNNGHYWVEIFPYNVMSIGLTGSGGVAVPDGTYPYVFRITAMAGGLRGSTLSVLRTYYVPYPMRR